MTSVSVHRPFKPLHAWFLESAVKHHDRAAIRTNEGEISYRELELQSAAYSAVLRNLAAGEDFIAVMTRRSPSALAGILGILRAGMAYLPLNPRFPAARTAYMLSKAGSSTVIAGEDSLGELRELLGAIQPGQKIILPGNEDPTHWSGLFPGHSFSRLPAGISEAGEVSVVPDRPAYLMFTSGSTGVPKGVPVSHGNVHAYLSFITGQFAFSPDDRFSQTFDLTFDLSVHDLFVCWVSGASLCLPDDNSSFGLSKYLKALQPTIWFSVPSVASLMNRMRLLKPGSLPFLRYSFFCGEPLPVPVARAWSVAAPRSRIINLYGPTEATIAVSWYELPAEETSWKQRHGIISIGKEFPGHSVKLGGANRNELLLSGPQVVKGYLDEPGLTAANFFKGDDSCVYYRTGDLAEQDGDGDLYFTGREDMEVKISGYRINLSEIEHVIRGMEGISGAVAVYNEDQGIASVIVPEQGYSPDSSVILERCRELLPWYMVPEKVIFVDEFPLNPNGKINRNALSAKYLSDNES